MPINKPNVTLHIPIRVFTFVTKINVVNENNLSLDSISVKTSELVDKIAELGEIYTISNINLYGNAKYLSKYEKNINTKFKYYNGMKVNIIEK